MIARWLYYFGLGWRDLTRLWATTQHHVIIVAGICLPILMLLGLKRGHVETLRQDLITSPTGRQVTFWSAQKGELMDRSSIERLSKELPSIDVIIPESQRIVRVTSGAGEKALEVESVTLFATRPGDPLLSQLKINSPARGAKEIVLGVGVAKKLNAKVGDEVTLTITRGRGDLAESAQVRCLLSAIMPTEELEAAIGYVDLDLLDQFDAYGRGFRVSELGWVSAKTAAPDAYSGYLFFCEAGNDLTENDRRFLGERGFKLVDRTKQPPEPLPSLLVPDYASRLIIYEARTEQSNREPRSRLRMAPSELSEATEADDVVLPWNTARRAKAGAKNWEMVGLSMGRRTWLREYFLLPALAFDYEADPLSFRGIPAHDAKQLVWQLGQDGGVELSYLPTEEEPVGVPPSGGQREETGKDEGKRDADGENRLKPGLQQAEPQQAGILVVPANLLAWVQAYGDGLVDFDRDVRLFVPKQQASIYDRARLYATTIDEVPAVVRALADRGFAVMSETGRITEIHRQDESLQLLVWVVGLGVFLFGVVTVFSVLMDSTDRKRATIGILRVMGMSRAGVFASILMRATAIGAAAAVLSLLCGWGLQVVLGWTPSPQLQWLHWKPIVSVQIEKADLLVVALGAMTCCGLGAIPPAWKASRLDPFDAIVEGRFR